MESYNESDKKNTDASATSPAKKVRFTSTYFRWGLTAFLVIAAGICFYYFMFHRSSLKEGLNILINIMMPIVFGLVLAYLLTPILNYIEYRIIFPLCEKCQIKNARDKYGKVIRGVSILLTTFLFFALIYALCAMMLSQIVPSLVSIINNFDTYINNITSWLNRLLDDNPELKNNILRTLDKYSGEMETWLNENVFNKTGAIIKTVSLSVIGVLKVLWNFIIGFVISIYVLASKENFAGQAKKMTYALFDTPTANIIIHNFRFTHKTFIGFLSGKIVDSIIIGLLCFIGTTLLNTPYAVLISVIIGVTNIIPFFGPALGAIPSTILVFVVDPLHPLNCVYFLIFVLVLQQFDGNVLGPKILGNSTGLASFWVLFSITVFGGLFGVLGMIVGVPIFAVIYAAIKSMVNSALAKRNLPQNTEFYLNVGSVDQNGFHEYIPEYRIKKEKNTSDKKAGEKHQKKKSHSAHDMEDK